MPDAPSTPAAPAATQEPPAAATTPPAPEAPAAPETKPTDPPKATAWDPEAAQAEIERLRRENGAARVNAKAQAAEEARLQLAQDLGKILGLVPDEADPAKLAQNLTASQAEAKQARVELAVFKAASAAKGDPSRLLEHKSFLASLDAIDPTDIAAVTAAIQAAVEANPWLGATPAGPQPPAPNPAQGSSASGAPGADQLTRAQVEQLARDGKYAEIDKAREEGRLDGLLGIKS